jgi:2-polyprenyl-3-methyl-5-hydroxy-6-metoxy-1,4-benzoquinol methylase
VNTRLDKLVDAVKESNPLQGPFLDASVRDLLPEELAELKGYLDYCVNRGESIDYLAKCYNTIVQDTLREQLHFQRYRRYRHSTYAEVADSVYQNDDYMRRYMFGLALTGFLWPNHREIHRYFIDRLPRASRGRYLEIGPGHGVYFLAAMRHAAFERFEAVDISPTSAAQTRDLIESGHFGSFSNYEITCRDFLADDRIRPGFAAVVMGEVLEHVEKPQAFMRRIYELAAPGAFVFVTTAINAPAIDHIYLFKSPAEVRTLCEGSGLRFVDELVVPYAGLSIEESQAQVLPVNIAMVLTR